MVRIGELKEAPNNPREIKTQKFHNLLESIAKFPAMLHARPIIINENFEVIGGNMRLRACRELGHEYVPTIQVQWDVEHQREFVIKDNLHAGQFDWDVLANEWDAPELHSWGLDLWQWPEDEPEKTPEKHKAVTFSVKCTNEQKRDMKRALERLTQDGEITEADALHAILMDEIRRT